ncbi:MAG: flagellin FliC, partial [Nitrospiraceae bacterium]|nr:flagellin FliC [Nitrospiraceae bacterium]
AQTAEGAMQENTDLLQRMRELAVESVNGTYGSSNRSSLNDEFQQLKKEITRNAKNTKFNGKVLLNGSLRSVAIQVGPDAGQTITLSAAATQGTGSAMTASGLGVGAASTTVLSAGAASTAITRIDAALKTVDTARGKLGAFQNRLEATVSNLMNVSENISAARSRIVDADFAAETSTMTKAQILQQAGLAMVAQANTLPQVTLLKG